MGESLESPLFS